MLRTAINYVRVKLGIKPDMAFVSSQLRKPSGFFGPKITAHMARSNKELFDFTLEIMHPKPREILLEIGFGNGDHFETIFSKYPEITLWGLDHSDYLIETATQMYKSYISAGKLSLFAGSSNKIPIPDHSVDKVYCNNVIYFWKKPGDHLSEIKRVLKPGGTLYCGFRTANSMKKLPFTSSGFILYEPHQWEEILTVSSYRVDSTRSFLEDRKINRDLNIKLESVCIAATPRA